jgi:hypothetical protein
LIFLVPGYFYPVLSEILTGTKRYAGSPEQLLLVG